MTKLFPYSLLRDFIVLSVILSFLALSGGWAVYQAQAVTTIQDVTMTAGNLVISASATATLAGKTVSTSSQTSTGNIANVSVTDPRGTGVGWTAVMTSKHFTVRDTVKDLAGSNSTVDFTGTYDGLDGVLDPNGTFIVEITTGGSETTAVFKWTDPAGNETTSVTAAASVTLSNGISATFATATYVTGDKWSVLVDTFPYTGLTVTPQATVAASGSLTGMSDGSGAALTGSGVDSDSFILITAPVNTGLGDYDQQENLSLTIHANSLDGQFKADATITVS